jgi:RimJ/RimL family protein N-acetyltransferase
VTSVRTEPIRTSRLDLEPLAVAHSTEMAAVLADPALHAFIGGEPLAADALHARYERLVAGSGDADVAWLNWVVRSRAEDELVGTVQATLTNVTGTSAGGVVAEVAWVIGSPWQGRGFAREAAAGLVNWLHDLWAQDGPPISAVVAHVHPEHTASAAVAAAAGLRRTDVVEDGEVRWELPSEPAP